MTFDIDRDGYFGVCPTCRRHDGMLNVGREQMLPPTPRDAPAGGEPGDLPF